MKRKRDQMLIIMCWVLYVSAYLGRYSYNTNLLPLSLYYGGLALIAQNHGWDAMFNMFLVACAAVVAACAAAYLIERVLRKKKAKEIA